MTNAHAHPPKFTVFSCVEVEHEEFAGAVDEVMDAAQKVVEQIEASGLTHWFLVEPLKDALIKFAEAAAEPGECSCS